MKHASKKTVGQKWHEEAVKHTKRDAIVLIFVVVAVWFGLLIAGAIYGNWMQEKALAEEAKAEEARLAQMEEDLRIFRDTQQHERQKAEAKMVREQLDILKEAEAQRIAEEEAAAAEAAWLEEQYYYYEPSYYVAPYDDSDGISPEEFKFMGVVETDDHFYTWYSERVLPGGGLNELNENGRYSDGYFVRDGDGYIAVASNDYEKGTIVDTPWGEGKVYDCGHLAEGQIDVYTSF